MRSSGTRRSLASWGAAGISERASEREADGRAGWRTTYLGHADAEEGLPWGLEAADEGGGGEQRVVAFAVVGEGGAVEVGDGGEEGGERRTGRVGGGALEVGHAGRCIGVEGGGAGEDDRDAECQTYLPSSPLTLARLSDARVDDARVYSLPHSPRRADLGA